MTAKTTAKKTTAPKAEPAPRTRVAASATTATPKRRPRKTTAAKPAADDRIATVTDLRKPLPTRPAGAKYTLHQLREARAALVAAQLGFRVPVLAWRTGPDALAYARLADGTILAHTGGPAPFTAYVPCRLGSHHEHPVAGPALLHAARINGDDCTTPHADFTDWSEPAARDLAQAFGGRRDAETETSEATTQVLPLSEAKGHPDVDA